MQKDPGDGGKMTAGVVETTAPGRRLRKGEKGRRKRMRRKGCGVGEGHKSLSTVTVTTQCTNHVHFWFPLGGWQSEWDKEGTRKEKSGLNRNGEEDEEGKGKKRDRQVTVERCEKNSYETKSFDKVWVGLWPALTLVKINKVSQVRARL